MHLINKNSISCLLVLQGINNYFLGLLEENSFVSHLVFEKYFFNFFGENNFQFLKIFFKQKNYLTVKKHTVLNICFRILKIILI